MKVGEIVFIGWKSIASACGIMSVSTIKNIAQKYDMPIRWINDKPIIPKEDLLNFVRKLPSQK